MEAFIISLILAVVITIIISIKERENIITSLKEFFCEYWQILKTIVPTLVIVAILLVGCFGIK